MQAYQENISAKVSGVLSPILGVSVTVTDTASGLPATLYSDNGVTQIAQPLVTDETGYFSFYAANGSYTVKFSSPQIAVGTRKIELYDRDDDAPLTQAQAASPTGASSIGFGQRTVANRLDDVASLADYPDANTAIAARAGKRMLVGPAETITLNIPAQFPTIPAAWAAIAGWIIAATGQVVIKSADGTYPFGASMVLNHPYGDRIKVIGNETTPANCVLQASGPGFDGIIVADGHTLGYLNGFKIVKATKAPSSDNTTGVLAVRGATIICGPKIAVDNWYYGIAARDGSMIEAPSAVVDHAGDVGIWAFRGSMVNCNGATVTNTNDSANGLGWNIQAEYGSTIGCQYATVSGAYSGGIGALSNSTVRAYDSISQNNAGHGLYATAGGTIVAHRAQTINNAGFGIYLGDTSMGIVVGVSIVNTGNTSGTYSTSVSTDVLGGQSRVLFYGPNGARFDNANQASMYFNTAGGLQFEIAHVDSSVNHFIARGSATGNKLLVAAVGSDATIRAAFAAKGAEVVALESNGTPAFQAYNGSTSCVNYGQVDGAATGVAVKYRVSGSDANIDLALQPKGTGVVQFGTLTASSDAPVTGYITIKDAGGTLRKLAVIA